MITCEEIYSLHTSKTPESDIHVAYRDIPLDSRNGMRKNDTPLHVACTFADEDAVRILLERGADVNVKNNDGDTPLCVLAKHNYCRQDICRYCRTTAFQRSKSVTLGEKHDRPD